MIQLYENDKLIFEYIPKKIRVGNDVKFKVPQLEKNEYVLNPKKEYSIKKNNNIVLNIPKSNAHYIHIIFYISGGFSMYTASIL